MYKSRYLRIILFAISILSYLIVSPAFGADYRFSLDLSSMDNHVTVSARNQSTTNALIKGLDVELAGNTYILVNTDTILPPNSDITRDSPVQLPPLPGTYPLIITLSYYNDKQIVTLRHVGQFSYREQALLPESCRLDEVTIARIGEIVISCPRPELWRLVLPNEIKIISEKIQTDRKVIRVKSTLDGLNNVYPYFAVAEDVKVGIHRTAFSRGLIRVQSASTLQSGKGKIPTVVLLALLGAFVIACCLAGGSNGLNRRTAASLHKYASRMILITVSYLMLKNADKMIACTLDYLDSPFYGKIANSIIGHFNGSNYQYFFSYFIDYYYLSCFFLLYPYLYYRESEGQLRNDKYSSLMMSVFSIKDVIKGGRLYWNYTSRLGFLTWCVKIFFVPYLVSWVINNAFHQFNISKSFTFDLATINAWLVALFIFIDTTIFCFGYIFEFDFLKNKIKSVDPTLFGWLVCLWCYPPFNTFSFSMFDHKLIDIGHTFPAWVLVITTCLITLLWGVFAWASVALGWKASNLTSRGIVKTGPYKYVRHPAYSAKLLVFYIQGIFLGHYFLGLLIGFTIIYVLRAWTEERHLSSDPDYIEYKEMVRWRFIPCLI